MLKTIIKAMRQKYGYRYYSFPEAVEVYLSETNKSLFIYGLCVGSNGKLYFNTYREFVQYLSHEVSEPPVIESVYNYLTGIGEIKEKEVSVC